MHVHRHHSEGTKCAGRRQTFFVPLFNSVQRCFALSWWEHRTWDFKCVIQVLLICSLNRHPRIYLWISEREEGRGEECWGERERERETLIWKRKIDRLPPVLGATRGGMCNLVKYHDGSRYGTMLLPTEPPCQGELLLILTRKVTTTGFWAPLDKLWLTEFWAD